MPPDLSAEVTVVPQFFDIDPLGIVWHGNHVKYLETARTALLTRLGYDYAEMKASGFSWPVTDLQVRYKQPLHLARPVIVRAEIVEWENRLEIAYTLRDAESGKRLAEARTVHVAVHHATNTLQLVCPRILWDKLGVSPSGGTP